MEFATSLSTGKTYEAVKVNYAQAKTLKLVCPVCKEKVFKRIRRIPHERHLFAHHQGGSPDCELYFPATSDQPTIGFGPSFSRGQTYSQFIRDIDQDLHTLLANAGLIAPTLDEPVLDALDVLVNKEFEHLALSFSAAEISNLVLKNGEKTTDPAIASVILEFYASYGARFVDRLFCKWFLYMVYFRAERVEIEIILSRLVDKNGKAFTSLAGLMLFGLAQHYTNGGLTGFCNELLLLLMTYSGRILLCDESVAAGAWTGCLGTLTLADGDKYVGEFKDGKYHGQGTHIFPDGEKYVGEFKDGKYNGQGTLTYANGWEYDGEFKDGSRNGQGTLTLPGGRKYVGEFKDRKLNGQGTGTFADDSKYVGEYKDGERNGQGTFTFADDSKYVGAYKDGKYNGQGTLTYANGNEYVGEFKDGKLNGQGTGTFADRSKYVGEWKDGERNGWGTVTYASGNKYVGESKDGKRNGRGTLSGPTGRVIYSGQWDNGEPAEPAP